MEIIASTGPGGKKVAANMTTLAQPIDSDDTQMYLTNTAPFSNGDHVWLEEEVVRIDTVGSPCSITRAQPEKPGGSNTDADSHAAGIGVRARDVTEILSKTFDGSTEYFEQMRVSGDYFFVWGIDVDGDVKYWEPSGEPNMGLAVAIFPFTRRITAAQTVKILVWCQYTRMFNAALLG